MVAWVFLVIGLSVYEAECILEEVLTGEEMNATRAEDWNKSRGRFLCFIHRESQNDPTGRVFILHLSDVYLSLSLCGP